MYRERGTVGSRPEVVDRKRINGSLERPSPSTSRQVNGKGKGTVTAASAHSVKQPHDHRDSRSVSLSKNNISDGEFPVTYNKIYHISYYRCLLIW